MKKIGWLIFVVMTFLPAVVADNLGCAAVKSPSGLIFPAADLLCLQQEQAVDYEALRTACRLTDSPELRDFVTRLIGQREAAKRAGFYWNSDAGTLP